MGSSKTSLENSGLLLSNDDGVFSDVGCIRLSFSTGCVRVEEAQE